MKNIKLIGTTLLTATLLVGCSTGGNSTKQNDSSNNNSSTTVQNNNSNSQEQTKNSAAKVENIEEQSTYLGEAIKVFQNTYPNLSIEKIELVTNSKPYTYKISALSSDKEYDYSYRVGSNQLSLLKEEVLDSEDRTKVSMKTIDVTTISNVDNIIKVAKDSDSNASVVSWKVDKDNGVVVWEVKLYSNGVSKEVKIDDSTNNIIKIDND